MTANDILYRVEMWDNAARCWVVGSEWMDFAAARQVVAERAGLTTRVIPSHVGHGYRALPEGECKLGDEAYDDELDQWFLVETFGQIRGVLRIGHLCRRKDSPPR